LKILITGAAGNLGSISAKSLLGRDGINLRLMFHSRALSPELLIANKSKGVEKYHITATPLPLPLGTGPEAMYKTFSAGIQTL
jgi:hypothetical protein